MARNEKTSKEVASKASKQLRSKKSSKAERSVAASALTQAPDRKKKLAEDDRTEDILRQRTTLPEELLSARRTTEVYIRPDEAIKYGLVDAVCDFSLPQGNAIVQI
jgi:hypothetical protein